MTPAEVPSSRVVSLRRDVPCLPTQVQALFEEHQSRLLLFLKARLGSATEAQDAVQTIFLRLCERSATVRDENPVALIYVMARNHATDLLRARTRQGRNYADPDRLAEVTDDAPLADRIAAARQDLGLITRILDELPEKCRTAFVRYKLEGIGYAEIEEELGVSESMVRKYVLRAVAHCSARFAELDGWI